MIVYPVNIEPHGDEFIARFPDVPSLTDCIGFERDDAILIARERLDWALTDLYLAGEPQPLRSALEAGQIGIATSLFWLVV